MNRADWLARRRVAVNEHYSKAPSPRPEGHIHAAAVQRRFVERLIATCPEGGSVLDAACGTGPYMGMVLAAGLQVTGADQSDAMLARARDRSPAAHLVRVGVQDLEFDGQFDAAMCLGAMEHLAPEEWPAAIGNLRRALKPAGHLYLVVKEASKGDVDAAFAEAMEAGLPAVYGEDVGDGTGGYCFYPPRETVDHWVASAGLAIADEESERLDGYGYRHLLCRVTWS